MSVRGRSLAWAELSLPVVPYKLYVVALVAFFDAVYTDGVPVRRVTGVTPAEKKARHH